MTLSFKNLSRYALLSLMAPLSLSICAAQNMPAAPMPPPHHREMRPMHRPMIDPVKTMQMRLDRLGSDLHLKPDQQAPWDALRTHLMNHAQLRAERIKARRAAMAAAHQASRQMPLAGDSTKPAQALQNPDQAIERRAQGLREQAKQLEQTASLMRNLYETLSPEQRTIMRLHREQGMAHHRIRHVMRMRMPGAPAMMPAPPMQRGSIEEVDIKMLAGPSLGAPMIAMLELDDDGDTGDAFDEALLLTE